jgi:hypothetical protein
MTTEMAQLAPLDAPGGPKKGGDPAPETTHAGGPPQCEKFRV